MGLVTVLYVFVKVSLFLPQWVEVRAFSILIVFSALSFKVLICSLNVSLGSKVSPSILGLRIVGSRVLSSCSDSSSLYIVPTYLHVHRDESSTLDWIVSVYKRTISTSQTDRYHCFKSDIFKNRAYADIPQSYDLQEIEKQKNRGFVGAKVLYRKHAPKHCLMTCCGPQALTSITILKKCEKN